jgi:hypothetical protein
VPFATSPLALWNKSIFCVFNDSDANSCPRDS